jgi:hypothetical protein
MRRSAAQEVRMISKILFAFALGAGSGALAQSTDTAAGVPSSVSTDKPANQTSSGASSTDVSVGTDATVDTGMRMSPMAPNTPTGTPDAPPMTNPATDGSATAWQSGTAKSYTGMGGPLVQPGADYPRCSRTVKDSCIQGPVRHQR